MDFTKTYRFLLKSSLLCISFFNQLHFANAAETSTLLIKCGTSFVHSVDLVTPKAGSGLYLIYGQRALMDDFDQTGPIEAVRVLVDEDGKFVPSESYQGQMRAWTRI